MQFRDKVVVVTGAGSGLGEQLAYALLQEGARVVLAGRRLDKLEHVVRTCSRPEHALAVATDITHFPDLEHLVKKTLEVHGRIDVLINNAGTSLSGPIDEIPSANVEYQLRLNLLAPIWLTQLVLPTLKMQPEAMIVNVSSVAGLVAPPYQSLYSGSKHGLRGFSNAIRRELHGTAVKVVTVYPGRFSSEHLNEDVQRTMKEVAPRLAGGVMAAALVVRAMKKEKANVVVAGKEKALVKLERWAPGILDRIFRRIGPKMREVLREINKWSQSRMSSSEPRS